MNQEWISAAQLLRPRFAERAASFDQEDRFVDSNYRDLASGGFFRMAIPEELGGGGASYETVCRTVYELAKGCSATALAFSMHTHLVAANVWKYHAKKPDAEPVLRRVATQNLALVSTGATDWVNSNGIARRVEGGYRVSGRKRFASGCPASQVLVTSATVPDDPEGPAIIHFSMPLSADGVKILDDWHTLGMRGSGSHTVVVEDVFVPDAAIGVKRPAGKWHPVWDVVLGVAPAVYMAPYVGLMDRVVEDVIEKQRSKLTIEPSELGELLNVQTMARLCWEDMIRLNDNYAFKPSLDVSNAQLTRKTLLTRSVRKALDLAVSITGGSAFYQTALIERLWRDVQGSQFHALPERRQVQFSGRHALGLDVSGV
jgi:alkylation response protein AidB-like acyl-CoA dehydrogenase